MDRQVEKHEIGICIPAGTNQNGVSLIKAALLATVEEMIVSAMPNLHPKLLPDDSEFEVVTPPEKEQQKPTLIYPLYAAIKGTIRYEFDRIEPAKPE